VTEKLLRGNTPGARNERQQFCGASGVRMKDRLSRLETRVDAMAGSLERIEARLRTLESRPLSGSGESVQFLRVNREYELLEDATVSERGEAVPILSLVGQICLVLCGAFLIRTLTGVGVLPTQLGLAVGPIYAVGWLLYADLLARNGKPRPATFFGAASVVIAFPLVWEAATKFATLGGSGSAVALSLVGAIALGVAWRRDLRDFAWLVTVGAMGTAFALLISNHQLVPVAAALLLLGAGTVWVTYSRGWKGLWWLPAIAVDLVILHMVYLASRPYSLPEWDTGLSVPAITALGLSLLLVYLASFAVPTLLRKREVSFFEVFQTAAALLVGFGGAAYFTEPSGSGSIALGAGALVLGLAYYVVAFAFSELHWGCKKNHTFHAWLAFVLTLSGSYLVTGGLPVLLAWCALSVAAAVLGARYKRATLYYHSAAYAVAAAFLAVEAPYGLITFAVEVFTLPADQSWPVITGPGLVIVSAAMISFVVIALSKADPERPWRTGIPRLALALVAALGGGAVMVLILAQALGNQPPEADSAVVAAVRTGVVAGAAVVLAAVSRLTGCVELRWLVYPMFIVGGLKLFLEDLHQGHPTTQLLAFALYGIALTLAPRLLRSDEHHAEATPQSQEG
jgi:hypothetical protein